MVNTSFQSLVPGLLGYVAAILHKAVFAFRGFVQSLLVCLCRTVGKAVVSGQIPLGVQHGYHCQTLTLDWVVAPGQVKQVWGLTWCHCQPHQVGDSTVGSDLVLQSDPARQGGSTRRGPIQGLTWCCC